jgi:hypothetical protein
LDNGSMVKVPQSKEGNSADPGNFKFRGLRLVQGQVADLGDQLGLRTHTGFAVKALEQKRPTFRPVATIRATP